MFKANDIVSRLDAHDLVHIISRNDEDLAYEEAEDLQRSDLNKTFWMLQQRITKYVFSPKEEGAHDNTHYIYIDASLTDLPTVGQMIPLLSGVEVIGVHFDDYANEMLTPQEALEYADYRMTCLHICDDDVRRDSFEIEMWLIGEIHE